MREERLYIQDILDSIDKIVVYTAGMSFAEFEKDQKTIDAVVRNFEIIGIASKNLSSHAKDLASDVEWPAIIAMRNLLSHEYFGADFTVVWKAIQDDLSVLKKAVEKIKSDLSFS